MANGGWYGTKEEWQRIEKPLLEIDDEIDKFSDEFDLKLTRNHKDHPGRSLEWFGNDVQCLIQIYLVDEKELTIARLADMTSDQYGRRMEGGKEFKYLSFPQISVRFYAIWHSDGILAIH